jgi:hypothetical protein
VEGDRLASIVLWTDLLRTLSPTHQTSMKNLVEPCHFNLGPDPSSLAQDEGLVEPFQVTYCLSHV